MAEVIIIPEDLQPPHPTTLPPPPPIQRIMGSLLVTSPLPVVPEDPVVKGNPMKMVIGDGPGLGLEVVSVVEEVDTSVDALIKVW